MTKGKGVIVLGAPLVLAVVIGSAMHQLALWLPLGAVIALAGLLIARREKAATKEVK
jgi:hypothetical protein